MHNAEMSACPFGTAKLDQLSAALPREMPQWHALLRVNIQVLQLQVYGSE